MLGRLIAEKKFIRFFFLTNLNWSSNFNSLNKTKIETFTNFKWCVRGFTILRRILNNFSRYFVFERFQLFVRMSIIRNILVLEVGALNCLTYLIFNIILLKWITVSHEWTPMYHFLSKYFHLLSPLYLKTNVWIVVLQPSLFMPLLK